MPRKSGVCDNLELPFETSKAATRRKAAPNFSSELAAFAEYGRPTQQATIHATSFSGEPLEVPAFINEFWTAKQRAAHSLHEVSYRACFKPQLPAFFIERLTARGEFVYDPFMGRGTTLIESALRSRIPAGCDVNPLSCVMVRPRLNPPRLAQMHDRLREIPFA